MPYNAAPAATPAMNSSGQWMSIAQIIAGLIGGGSSPGTPTGAQSDALASGQGPLNASAANSWSNSLTTFGGGNGISSAPTPGYNTNQFGVPLGTQQSNSY